MGQGCGHREETFVSLSPTLIRYHSYLAGHRCIRCLKDAYTPKRQDDTDLRRCGQREEARGIQCHHLEINRSAILRRCDCLNRPQEVRQITFWGPFHVMKF